MKTLLFILLCAVGGFYAYRHFTDVPPPPSAPAPAPRLAPKGVFFLKERFSEKTELGVRALRAGSEVKLVSKDATTSVVSDANNNEFKVPTEILTNDLDVRDAVLKKAAEQSPKGSSVDPNEVARKTRISELQREIERQELRLEELNLSRKRAEEDLAKEKAKGSSLSGSPLQGEQATRKKIEQLAAQIVISDRKIEDARLAIKKLEFNDQPMPFKASQP